MHVGGRFVWSGLQGALLDGVPRPYSVAVSTICGLRSGFQPSLQDPFSVGFLEHIALQRPSGVVADRLPSDDFLSVCKVHAFEDYRRGQTRIGSRCSFVSSVIDS